MPDDTEAMRKELEQIKAEKMRRELEDIKLEKMRQELSDLKSEKGAAKAYKVEKPAAISLVNLVFAAASLFISGYLIGTILGFDSGGLIESYAGNILQGAGVYIVALLSAVLALVGIGLILIVKK